MRAFERMLDATAVDYERHIRSNPIFEQLNTGQATCDQYAVYLRETYHLVRHTSRALARGASRLDDDQRSLRAWLLEQASEEHGHELFCLKDLQNLGLPAASVTAGMPGPGAWGVVTQNYYLADAHPSALLGVASATEGMGAELAGDMAAALVHRLGVPASATTFLRSHAGLDQRHFAQVTGAVDALVGDADFDWVVHARRMTFQYYGQLLHEAAFTTERFFQMEERRHSHG